jgi:hypothetical protein
MQQIRSRVNGNVVEHIFDACRPRGQMKIIISRGSFNECPVFFVKAASSVYDTATINVDTECVHTHLHACKCNETFTELKDEMTQTTVNIAMIDLHNGLVLANSAPMRYPQPDHPNTAPDDPLQAARLILLSLIRISNIKGMYQGDEEPEVNHAIRNGSAYFECFSQVGKVRPFTRKSFMSYTTMKVGNVSRFFKDIMFDTSFLERKKKKFAKGTDGHERLEQWKDLTKHGHLYQGRKACNDLMHREPECTQKREFEW